MTYVTMGITKKAFDEIRVKLEEAGYRHAISSDGPGKPESLDLDGIVLQVEEQSSSLWCYNCRHERCRDCQKTKWNIAGILGLICCKCQQPASVERWLNDL